MKKKRISTYITLLTLLSSMLLYSPTLAAQEKKTTIEEEKVPFYQGTTIGVDIFGLGSKIFGGHYKYRNQRGGQFEKPLCPRS